GAVARRARPRLPPRSRRDRLARGDELLRLSPSRLVVAAVGRVRPRPLPRPAGAALRRAAKRDDDACLSSRTAVAGGAPLVDAARQPRHSALSQRLGLARPPPR